MKAYQFKITLCDVHPPVWRRFTVPASLSFTQFILVLNEVMGWENAHMSMFAFNQLHIELEDEPEPEQNMFSPNEVLDAAQYLLEEFVEEVRSFRYVYDFGDGWTHKIELEKIIEDSREDHPVLLKFKGECPWEDCGGPYGYQHMLDVLDDPNDEEYDQIREWTGGGLPQYDPEDVNAELRAMRLRKAKTEPVHLEEAYNALLTGKGFKQVVPDEDRDEERYDFDDDDDDFDFDDDDPDDSDPDARFEAKVDALLSDPEVREQLIATIGIGITVQVVDLLLKNSGHTEAEIYRFLEMDKDMIEEVKMARQMIHAAEEDELSKQRNKKKKK